MVIFEGAANRVREPSADAVCRLSRVGRWLRRDTPALIMQALRKGGSIGTLLIVLTMSRRGGIPHDRRSPFRPATPFRQMAAPNGQDVHISRGIPPLPPIAFGGRRGGSAMRKS